MNTLVKKEIRLLLPAFAGAMALALPIWLFPARDFLPGNDVNIAALLYLFGTVMLALSSFGREISLKTFPLLLAQPLERSRIWWTKITVLGVSVALAFGAWGLCGCFDSWRRPAQISPREFLEVLAGVGLFAAVLTAGGLWMTLLLRQTIAAFWLTLLMPMAIISAIKLIGGADWMIFTALGLYAVAAFLLAWRQFLHLQDTAWTGGVITFGRTRAATERSAERTRRPWAALLRKELQVQQITLVGMVCLLVLHLGIVLLRKTGANTLGKDTLSVLEMFGLLWFVVPWLAGSLSVAEERQLGTLDSLLCLPVSRRFQFVVKMFFVMALGLLSAALLCMIEGMAHTLGAGKALAEYGLVAGLFMALALASFYASTLTRGVVPALAGGVVAAFGFWKLGESEMGWHINGILFLVVAVIWLSYGNFRYLFESGRRSRRNILGLILVYVLSGGASSAIYNRTWERAMPLEGTHGSARLPAGKPALLYNFFGSGLAAVLPDGRLWVDRTAYEFGRLSHGMDYFVAGSNWVETYQNYRETAGIRSDGTLWVTEKPQRHASDRAAPMVQFGVESNWLSLASDTPSSVVLLKRNGTLWFWGNHTLSESAFWGNGIAYFNTSHYQGLRTFVPIRLGAESDWAQILRGNQWIYAWKRDGLAWALHGSEQNKDRKNTGSDLAPPLMVERAPMLDHVQFRNLNSSQLILPVEVGVRDDGTLWYWNWFEAQHPNIRPPANGAPLPGLVQIGKDSNWAQVAGGFTQMLGLKTDGTIWKWKLYDGQTGSIQALQHTPEQLGTHDDWIAVGYWLTESVTLAADGTLWRWSKSGFPEEWSGGFLAPSRRPAKIENILDARE